MSIFVGPLSQPYYGASFKQSVVRFFKKYARFNGYASRSEYWWAMLFCALVTLPGNMLMKITESTGQKNYYGAIIYDSLSGPNFLLHTFGAIITALVILVLIIPSFAAGCRRLHDAGFSGMWVLLYFIPFAAIVPIIMQCLPTKKSARRAKWDDMRND